MTTLDLPVTHLSGALGVSVGEVDLRDVAAGGGSIDAATVRALLDEHLVLFFPGQNLTDDEHLALGLSLGKGYIHPLGRMRGNTEVRAEHIRDTPETPPYQDQWHTDVSWDPDAPRIGTLRALEMPERGGDTVWASAYAAYDALSDEVKGRIESLSAIHDMGLGKAFETKMGPELVAKTRALFPGVSWPVVRRDTPTGRPLLYVNKGFTREIEGTEADTELLAELCAEFTNPNVQVRYRWAVGDVAIWDELTTQHFAVNDYMPACREMARVVVN